MRGLRSLLCTVGSGTYAIPIEHVIETLRPLPVTHLAGAPSFVSGVAIIRGEPLPVITPGEESVVERFVVVRVGTRRAALAVGRVLGIRDISLETAGELPPIFRGAKGADAIAKIGSLDAQLLVVLDVVRLVPESVLDAVGASS